MGCAGDGIATGICDRNRIAPCVIDIARDKVTGSVEYLVNVSGKRAADDIVRCGSGRILIPTPAQRTEWVIRIAQDDTIGALFIMRIRLGHQILVDH